MNSNPNSPGKGYFPGALCLTAVPAHIKPAQLTGRLVVLRKAQFAHRDLTCVACGITARLALCYWDHIFWEVELHSSDRNKPLGCLTNPTGLVSVLPQIHLIPLGDDQLELLRREHEKEQFELIASVLAAAYSPEN